MGTIGILLNMLTKRGEAQRTPTKFVPLGLAGLALVAGEVAAWKPEAGKKFRLMGWHLEATATQTINFRDGVKGPILFTLRLTEGIDYPSPDLKNGILSALAANELIIESSGIATLHGTIYGTEE